LSLVGMEDGSRLGGGGGWLSVNRDRSSSNVPGATTTAFGGCI